ncbi:Fibrous sheath-interacting protein 1 [Bagarius yarrelli]|uniref:Fibrous sheath-interacting protein 1 n=1 Tax=Bagarius yarrelli TaxID=175774 RepID=A0A556UFD0_BAGYA|nr:Fibrous sheath-interacting protein 1 [Bagarius yarrelli]
MSGLLREKAGVSWGSWCVCVTESLPSVTSWSPPAELPSDPLHALVKQHAAGLFVLAHGPCVGCNEISGEYRMDVTKGSLDNISRPASSERSRPGSRVSSVVLSEGVRMSQDRIGSLEILSSELTETEDQENIKENDFKENLASDQDPSVEETNDPELQKAIIKMERLDKILATKISNEKEVKKQGKELHLKLWKELKEHKPARSSECIDEAENTRMFLAYTSNTSAESEVKVHGKSSKVASPEVKEVKKTESRQNVMGKNKPRQDFIKKNIELVSSAGSLGLLTQEEKERLEELLKNIDEEEISVDSTAKPEAELSLYAVSTTPDEGYKPQAAELEQLLQIDAKLQLLLPVEEFLTARGPYGFHSFSQVKKAGELGERVLQDMKESRKQEECLCEIQQQLQLLTLRQHPDSLTEEQMKNLLLECEMARSRTSESDTEGFAVDGQLMSLLVSTPRLSSSALSELWQEGSRIPERPIQEAQVKL